MKIKFASDLIVNIVIGLALSFTLLPWALLMFLSGRTHRSIADAGPGYYVSIVHVNNLKPIAEAIPDNIPYYQHQRLQDSITQLQTLRNGDGTLAGSAVYLIGIWGTYASYRCDTCKIEYNKYASPTKFPIINKPVQAYLMLYGWKIKPTPVGFDSTVYFVKHGQAYLRKQMIDSTYKNSNGKIQKVAHTRDIAVPFAYNREFKCIMIPVTAANKTVLDVALSTIAILGIIYFMFFILGGFIKFLIDVSRGQIFTVKNIRRLKVIGFSLIAFEILIFLINLCMPLIFHAYFTNDVVLNEKSWDGSWKGFVAGIAFLLLYKAFCSGKKIKEEQDLVI